MIFKQPAHHWLLLNALINPASLVEYNGAKWELLLRLARKVKLLGRLATDLKNRGLLDQIPLRAANTAIKPCPGKEAPADHALGIEPDLMGPEGYGHNDHCPERCRLFSCWTTRVSWASLCGSGHYGSKRPVGGY